MKTTLLAMMLMSNCLATPCLGPRIDTASVPEQRVAVCVQQLECGCEVVSVGGKVTVTPCHDHAGGVLALIGADEE